MNGNSRYLIRTVNDNYYAIGNNMMLFQYNSLEKWMLSQIDFKYEITYYGWRIPILNAYPCIIDMNKIDLKLLITVHKIISPH
jgi:hypothetical protein